MLYSNTIKIKKGGHIARYFLHLFSCDLWVTSYEFFFFEPLNNDHFFGLPLTAHKKAITSGLLRVYFGYTSGILRVYFGYTSGQPRVKDAFLQINCSSLLHFTFYILHFPFIFLHKKSPQPGSFFSCLYIFDA